MKGNKGGRPTSYTEEIQKKADKYLENCIDEYKTYLLNKTETTKDYQGSESTETKTVSINRLQVKLPTIEGLAKFINVNRSTIYEWIKQPEYSEFSNTIERLKEEQAERVINMGMTGEYNSTIAKLLLASHGYVEKQEVKTEGVSEEAKSELYKKLTDKIDDMKADDINIALNDLLN